MLHHTNKMKDKNHIISVDAQKTFDKIKQTFMIKTLNKVGLEKIHPNITKATYDKPIANITLTGKKLKIFSLRSKTRQRCPLSSAWYWESWPEQLVKKKK